MDHGLADHSAFDRDPVADGRIGSRVVAGVEAIAATDCGSHLADSGREPVRTPILGDDASRVTPESSVCGMGCREFDRPAERLQASELRHLSRPA